MVLVLRALSVCSSGRKVFGDGCFFAGFFCSERSVYAVSVFVGGRAFFLVEEVVVGAHFFAFDDFPGVVGVDGGEQAGADDVVGDHLGEAGHDFEVFFFVAAGGDDEHDDVDGGAVVGVEVESFAADAEHAFDTVSFGDAAMRDGGAASDGGGAFFFAFHDGVVQFLLFVWGDAVGANVEVRHLVEGVPFVFGFEVGEDVFLLQEFDEAASVFVVFAGAAYGDAGEEGTDDFVDGDCTEYDGFDEGPGGFGYAGVVAEQENEADGDGGLGGESDGHVTPDAARGAG